MLYIDAFNHILPKKYQAALEQKGVMPEFP